MRQMQDFRILIVSGRERIAALLVVCATLLWPAILAAQEFRVEELDTLFPNSGPGLQADEASGSPPACRVFKDGQTVGYAFSTRAVAGSVGYSGKPLDIHVGLTTDGKISGTWLAAHQEPILVIGIASEELEAFVSRFKGLDIKTPSVTRLNAKRAGPVDHVAGATVSSTVMRDAVLRSAREVALSRGIIGGGAQTGRIDRTRFESADWPALMAMGAIGRRTITRGEVANVREYQASEANEIFIDFYAALLTPAMIGQNLLGQRTYEQLTANIGPNDNLIMVAANGLYSLKGTAWRRSGVFERIQIAQGNKTIPLRRDDHQNVSDLKALSAPDLREVAVFRVATATGFDPARPWRLELLVMPSEEDKTAEIFALDYEVPDRFVIPAADTAQANAAPPMELWEQIWRERLPELITLAVMLFVLTLILFGQDWLARRKKLYLTVRLGFLTLTLLFIGFYAGAQLSVVNVVTFTHALMSGFKWDLFLLDPLVFTLWSFVALALLFWGRGVFCGWLCPFGALQELLNVIARKAGLAQIQVPWGLHERLWPIKYVAFLVILGISFQSITAAYRVAEIEPFKTAIILNFIRDWPFVVYAIVLLVLGLFIERFFCRYLCPLGAALAIPAKLRLFEWLRRRPQCGRECRICNTRCTVQAIHPLGQINPNECIYCLRCQVIMYDAETCPPLKRRVQRRALHSSSEEFLAQRTTNGS
jgi:NosR/NirI family nitrite reductase transcriptional regulator